MEQIIKFLDRNIGQLYLLKSGQAYFNQEVMFNYDDKTYLWQGDFSIASEIVTIDQTYSFSCLDDQCEAELTHRLNYVLRYEILNNY